MTIRTLAAFAFAATLCAHGAAAEPNWGQASLRIQQGMTEAQAIAAVGHDPARAEITTCGLATKGPWTCRILVFGGAPPSYRFLTVMFAQTRQGWLVEGWASR